MTTEIFGLLAETFIHPGSGRSEGAIDLPVARERTTDYPYIPGSSMKGALRDAFGRQHEKAKQLFGECDSAGELLISDARLLLLPVRSLSACYHWLTCPYLIERFTRDLARAGRSGPPDPEKPGETHVLAEGKDDLWLEERVFEIAGVPSVELVSSMKPLIACEAASRRLAGQLAIVSDANFKWFAKNGLPVQARNVLDEKKTSKNLWYEEALPPDTLMYFLVGERGNGASTQLAAHLTKMKYLQTGANETVGEGWFAVARLEGLQP